VLIATAGGFLGFFLLVSAVPYIAARSGGRFAAGLLTFALMLTTIAMQAVIAPLLRRFSPRALFVTGLLLMGPPTVLYSLSQSVASLTAVTLIRGAGFGLITVLASSLVAAYARPGSRGSALGVYGVAATVWAAFAPALGVALSRSSIIAISLLGMLPPLVGLMGLLRPLPPATIQAPSAVNARPVARLALGLPLIVFTAVAAAIAAGFTFLPLLVVASAPVLLLLFGLGFAAGRLLAGRLLDRGRSPTALVLILLGNLLLGLTMLATSDVVAVAMGAAISGLGSGCLCTVTLAMMFDRTGPGGIARASILWNLSYDVGQAIGAIALGAVATLLKPGDIFFVAAGVVIVVAGPAAACDWLRARAASCRRQH
jgi:MFS family permease